jgi:hypothetical protein
MGKKVSVKNMKLFLLVISEILVINEIIEVTKVYKNKISLIYKNINKNK